MSFQILGPVEAARGSDDLELGPPKQRAFLAYLLTRANRTVFCDQLVEALWGDGPPPTAVKALQVFVSRLRKALGEDAGLLVTSGSGYRLQIEDEQLDSIRFEQQLAAGERALEQDDPHRAEAMLEQALDLFRGAPLAGIENEPFADNEAGRSRSCACARSRGSSGRSSPRQAPGGDGGAGVTLRSVFRCAKGLRALWMRALYAGGRQADGARGLPPGAAAAARRARARAERGVARAATGDPKSGSVARARLCRSPASVEASSGADAADWPDQVRSSGSSASSIAKTCDC